MKAVNYHTNRYLLALVLIFSQIFAGASANENSPIRFAIPEQKLANSLIILSKQARMPIIFHSKITDKIKAPALYKTVTTKQALSKLLVNTDLFFSIIEQRFIVITRQVPPAKNSELTLEHLYPPGLEQIHIYGHLLTGSRLARSDIQGSTPIDVLQKAELDLRGSVTVAEKLKFLPAVSGNPTSTAVTNGGDGTATVTLRGLPASNTLVLINGRRVAADGLVGDAIDLNTVAPAAIDRIEILKDGASAIYGADAIAGVVNIVMKDHFDGLLLETFYGETSRGDMETANTNLLWGRDFERGSIFASFTGYKQNGILSRDRSRSANADGRAWGGIDARSSATPAARIKLPSGQTVTLDQSDNGAYLDPSDPANYREATDEDLYNYSVATSAFVPHEHKSIYASLQFDLSDQVGFFLETSFDDTSAETTFAPTPITTAFETNPFIVSADNIYNPFDADIADIRRRMVEIPIRVQKNDSTAKRISTGLSGQYNHWSWDTSYSWSKSDAREKITNLIDTNSLVAAVGPNADCIDSCVPLNLFGAPGDISADQIAFVLTEGRAKGFSKLTTWSFNTVGPLINIPAGLVELAAGLEYRTESTSKKPIRKQGQGPTIGGANFEGAVGSRNVTDAYIESSLPLLNGGELIHSLTLELSARHSRYSDFGNVTNPKVGVMLRPSKGFLLRSTWSKGFRAPSLNELYNVSGESQQRIVDPCAITDSIDELPGCEQQTDINRSQYITQFEGNEDLEPERSTNYTIGAVWTPSHIPGFTTSMDIFQIKQKDVVDANAQNIVNLDALTNAFSHLVIRNSDGEIQKIIARNLNVGERKVQGLDISSRYQLSTGNGGHYAFAFNASHIHSYTIQSNEQTPVRDIAGTFVDDAMDGLGSIPKWKANIGLFWKSLPWQATYTIHFVSSLDETVPETNIERRIHSWTTHDMQAGYTFNDGKGVQLLAGIDNLFDTPPPRVASGFNNNLDARTHELKGMFFYLKLSQQF